MLTAARVEGGAGGAVGVAVHSSSLRVMAGSSVVAIVGLVGAGCEIGWLSERSRRGHQCSKCVTMTACRRSCSQIIKVGD